MYGWTPGTVVAQNAPVRLSGRTGPSIHCSSKKRPMIAPVSSEKSLYAPTTIRRASSQDVLRLSVETGAKRS
jgi:hypothetical protein